ncbi:MAG: hypothetical protein HRU43_04055, partial [Simkaniaceae bacterium]|nr:hypothetical protein [Simkaniaceae bacterium]
MVKQVDCGPLPAWIDKDYFEPARIEGYHQFQLARLSGKKLPDLLGRVTHIVKGVLLYIPLVNVVALKALTVLKMTAFCSFERAILSGQKDEVVKYVQHKLHANAKDRDGKPFLHLTFDKDILCTLLQAKADPKQKDGKGRDFLTHLLENNKIELAESLVREGYIDVRPYLTDDYFHKLIKNGTQIGATFLFRMGYDAPIEKRQLLGYPQLKTGQQLEWVVLRGDYVALRSYVNDRESFEVLEDALKKLTSALPELQVGWIWEHVLYGYLNLNRILPLDLSLDLSLVEDILRKDRSAQSATSKQQQPLLLELYSNHVNEEFLLSLVEKQLIDPTSSFKRFSSENGHFLIKAGYQATIDQRKGLPQQIMMDGFERAVFFGDQNALRKFGKLGRLDLVDGYIERLKDKYPLIQTDWIWIHIFNGYLLEPKMDNIDEEHLSALLMRCLTGNQSIDPESKNYMSNDQIIECLHAWNVSKKNPEYILEGLVKQNLCAFAELLVKEKVVSIREDFEKFHKGSFPDKMYVWFLAKMGYDMPLHKDYCPQGGYVKELVGNCLEEIAMTLDTQKIDSVARIASDVQTIITDFKELEKHFPRLKARWVMEKMATKYFDAGKYDPFLRIVNEGLYRVNSKFYEKRRGTESPEGRMALMKAGYDEGPLFRAYKELYVFSDMVWCHDKVGVLRLAKEHGFQTIYDRYLEMKSQHPYLDMRWMWNALFEIPQSHFQAYGKIQGGLEVLEPPKKYGDLKAELSKYFKKIDFLKINPDQLIDTVNIRRSSLQPKDLREAAERVGNCIKRGETEYDIGDQDKQLYIKQINWILYYLEQDLGKNYNLSDRAAIIMVDMLKECIVCHSRWNEAFDTALKRLGNIEIVHPGIDEQIAAFLGQTRGHIVEMLAQRNTHERDYLIHFLRKSRGLPQQPVRNPLLFGHAIYKSYEASEIAFDKHYTPGEIIEGVYAFLRGSKDSYNLLLDSMGNALAPNWHKQDQELRKKAEKKGLDARLSFKELEDLGFKGIPRKNFSFEEFLKVLEGYTLKYDGDDFDKDKKSCFDRLKEKSSSEFVKKWMPEAIQRGAIKESKALPTPNEIFMACMRNGIHTTEVADEFRGRDPEEFKVMLELAENFSCKYENLDAFYEAHKHLKPSRKSIGECGVKRHIISLAHQLEYHVSHVPLEKTL